MHPPHPCWAALLPARGAGSVTDSLRVGRCPRMAGTALRPGGPGSRPAGPQLRAGAPGVRRRRPRCRRAGRSAEPAVAMCERDLVEEQKCAEESDDVRRGASGMHAAPNSPLAVGDPYCLRPARRGPVRRTPEQLDGHLAGVPPGLQPDVLLVGDPFGEYPPVQPRAGRDRRAARPGGAPARPGCGSCAVGDREQWS